MMNGSMALRPEAFKGVRSRLRCRYSNRVVAEFFLLSTLIGLRNGEIGDFASFEGFVGEDNLLGRDA